MKKLDLQENGRNKVWAIVLVAALGYFVDIYDLLLFSIVRVPSLRSMGLDNRQITENGILLLNIQMIGLLIGGIFWGIMGDKKGRLSVLFGSILIYSVANIANSFVGGMASYTFWRFVAGIGLAGELGAGITLVSEVMPKDKRGYGTTIVASVGISGAVVAYFVAKLFDWRTAFLIGGCLGIFLLLLRIGVLESGMFGKVQQNDVKKGNFLVLFTSSKLFGKYIRCILIGVPLWYVVGILITLSPEFGKVLRVQGIVNAGASVAFCYAGLVTGDICCGLLSQWLKSRKKVIYIFLTLSLLAIGGYFFFRDISTTLFYLICYILGLTVGYWVIFMTIAAEQFGTNLRATVTTTVPNFVRGAVVPLTFIFKTFTNLLGGSIVFSGLVVGGICLTSAYVSLFFMQETFDKDLDYME